MVILRLFSSKGGEPDDMRRQIMVIPHTFLPSGDDRVRWLAETNNGHSTPFVIQGRRVWWQAETNYGHSTHFCQPETIVSDGMQREIIVILRLLSSRGSEPDDMQR